MIWIILFFIIILISSVLAYRSMRDYEEFPEDVSQNSLFYIGNPHALTEEVLRRFHSLFSSKNHFFALERLMKGAEKAIVVFGPSEMIKSFPELGLVELEDYIATRGEVLTSENADKKVDVNQSLTWLVDPKNTPKKNLLVNRDTIRNLDLKNDQKTFIQLVLMPDVKSSGLVFQATLRLMVVDKDSLEKVELAKKINRIFNDATGLNKHEDNFPETRKFESFKQRSLVPKEVVDFPLSPEEILALM